MSKLYVCFVPDPHFQSCVDECVTAKLIDEEFAGWQIVPVALSTMKGSFNPLDLYSRIAKELGPVMFVGGVQATAVATLRQKLANRVIVDVMPTAADSWAVYDRAKNVVERDTRGEPEWPRRLGVALMVVAKLERFHYWGGNDKGFLRVDDIANGRGVDRLFQPVAHEVCDYLASGGRNLRLLDTKLGDGRRKYSCNNGERQAVYSFLRTRTTSDAQVNDWLTRDTAMLSNRALEHIDPDKYEDPR